METRLWLSILAITLAATSLGQSEISRDSFTATALNPETEVKFVRGLSGNRVITVSNVLGDVCIRSTLESGALVRTAWIDTKFASTDFCADLEVDVVNGRIYVLTNSSSVFGERTTITCFNEDLTQIFQVHPNNGNLKGVGRDLVFAATGKFAVAVNIPDPVSPSAKVVGFSETGSQEWIADAFNGVTVAHSVSKLIMKNNIEFFVGGQDEIGAFICTKKITTGTESLSTQVAPPGTKGAQLKDIEVDGETGLVLFTTVDLSTQLRKSFVLETGVIPGLTEIQEVGNASDMLLDGRDLVVLSNTGVLTKLNLDSDVQTTFRPGTTGGVQIEKFDNRYVVAFGRQYVGLNRTTFAIEGTVTEPSTFFFRHMALSATGAKIYLGFALSNGSSVVKIGGNSTFSLLNGFSYRAASAPHLMKYIDSDTDELGNLYVANQAVGGTQASFITAFSGQTGQILWRKKLSVFESDFPFLKDIAVDGNGDVYWIGGVLDGSTFVSIVQKLNGADGGEVWTEGATDPSQNGLRFERIAVRASQLSIVGPSGASDYRAVGINKQTGANLFNVSVPGLSGAKTTGDIVIDSQLRTTVMVLNNPRSTNRALVQILPNGTLTSRTISDVSVFQACIMRLNPLDILYSANTRNPNIIERFEGLVTRNSAAIPDPNDLQVSGATVLLGSDQGLDILNPTTGLLLRRFSFANTTAEKVAVDSRDFVYGFFANHIDGAISPNASQLRKFKKNGAFLFNIVSDSGDRSQESKAIHLTPNFNVWTVSEEAVQGAGTQIVTRLISQSQAPKAFADTFAGTEDVRLIIAAPGVLANDSDLTGSTLIPERVTNVPSTVGNVVVNPNGSVVFTPKPNFSGTTSFTYRVRDEEGLFSTPVTVTINMAPVNDAPIALPDTFAVRKGQTLNVVAPGVLANDSDVDGDPITAQLRTGVTNGTLTFRSNGSLTYIAPQTTGVATFTYRVRDTSGLVSPDVTVTINVID